MKKKIRCKKEDGVIGRERDAASDENILQQAPDKDCILCGCFAIKECFWCAFLQSLA